jgi:hypothetical protein
MMRNAGQNHKRKTCHITCLTKTREAITSGMTQLLPELKARQFLPGTGEPQALRSNSGTMRSMGEGHPPVGAISRSCPVETLRQYNLKQRRRERRGAKKRLARAVIEQSYFRDNAPVIGIPQITPPLQGRGRGWGLSALRKPIDPTPTPPLKGRGLISQHATQQGKGENHATLFRG